MNQQLRKLQNTFGVFYIPLVILVMSVLIFVIGYSEVQPVQYNFQVNQVAEETIQAPVTIEDAEQTAINQEKARSSVSDAYVFQPSIAEEQLELVNQYFVMIKEIRELEYSTNDIQQLLNNNDFDVELDSAATDTERSDSQTVPFGQLNAPEQLIIYYTRLMTESEAIKELSQAVSDGSIMAMLQANEASLNEYRNQVSKIIQLILATEIESTELNQAVSSAIDQVNNLGLSESNRRSITEMMQELIVPTSIYSESETEKRREEAASAVQPSYILQGQIIAQEGHIIDQSTYRKLDLLGYLDRHTNNDLLIIFALIVIIHGFISFYVFIRFNEEDTKNSTNNKNETEVTAYAILFVIGLFLVKVLHLVQINGIDYALLLFPIYCFVKLLLPRTNYRLTVFFIIFFNLMSIFIAHDGDSMTATFIITVFYFFSSLLALIYRLYLKDNLSTKQELTFALVAQTIFMSPIVLMANVSLVSDPSLIILLFTLLNAFISISIFFFIEPYWHKLLSSKAPLTLNQLANLNHPLLKEIVEKAPGSYHHSMMVANIAASAAIEIEADSDLVRIASYYHDVGKTLHPLFFIENLSDGMESPHSMVTAEESASIIIDHVIEGEKLLREHNMPESIINICMQHHGTTLVKFFYVKAKEENPNIDPDLFRYPGPKPQSKESMIIMLADSVEAASRSMKERTQASIENLVDRIIEGKLEEGQFEYSGITVSELSIIRKAMVQSVASTYHTRVEYPD